MALAPTVAGYSAHIWSWRTTQYQIAEAAVLAFLLIAFFQPETVHPGTRGVDKQIESEGRSRWVWLNPLGSLSLVKSPNVLLVVSGGMTVGELVLMLV